jgi:hypothetical protein
MIGENDYSVVGSEIPKVLGDEAELNARVVALHPPVLPIDIVAKLVAGTTIKRENDPWHALPPIFDALVRAPNSTGGRPAREQHLRASCKFRGRHGSDWNLRSGSV